MSEPSREEPWMENYSNAQIAERMRQSYDSTGDKWFKAAAIRLAAKPERGRVIEFALQPFIDGLSGTDAAKMIDKRYPGLSPIQIVVTKFQYQAAKDALKGTPA